MKTALVIALLLAPAQAFSSCESGITAESRELSFTSFIGIPMSRADFPPVAEHAHFRRLAHAVAMAQCCLDTATAYSCEAGTPPRTRIMLASDGRLEALDGQDSNAVGILRRCQRGDFDSTCFLWTVEIGRFNTEAGAQARAAENGAIYLDGSDWDRSRDASLFYESCGGTWEPAAFIVRMARATVAPWSVRHGLYFTRGDAVRAATGYGSRARVMRQRVDGALLEQALREPVEGC
jgi:hypothetical protein